MHCTTEKKWPEIGLSMRQRREGLEISQGGKAYIARDWQLSNEVLAVVEMAISCGFTCFIQNEHPKENMLFPHGKGADYITFSRKQHDRWLFVLDLYSCANRKKGTPRMLPYQVTFYITYKPDLERNGVPFELMGAANGRGILVPIEYLAAAIAACQQNLDHTSSIGGPRGVEQKSVKGFLYEGNLQARMIKYWSNCNFGKELVFVDQEIAFDGNRLDILARVQGLNQLVLIELKHPKAEVSSVNQITRYMEKIKHKQIGIGKQILGAIIAEQIPQNTRNAILTSSLPIRAFEAKWCEDGVCLLDVSGSWDI